jgi:hypothetical protein
MALERDYTVDDLLVLTPDIARRYANTNRATILRDLKELLDLRLLLKVGNRYRANGGILKAMLPDKKG